MRVDGTWCIPNGEEIMVCKKNTFNFYVNFLLLGVIIVVILLLGVKKVLFFMVGRVHIL